MKLNNKGFAITLVLYGTLVLFLLLIVSLLGILSTYKLRLEKIYPEQEIEDKKLTCKVTMASYTASSKWISVKISVSDESLLYSENPYYFNGWRSTATTGKSKSANSDEYFTVKVKDKFENEIVCGNVSVVKRWGFNAGTIACSTPTGYQNIQIAAKYPSYIEYTKADNDYCKPKCAVAGNQKGESWTYYNGCQNVRYAKYVTYCNNNDGSSCSAWSS